MPQDPTPTPQPPSPPPLTAALLTMADAQMLRQAVHIANHAAACHVAERCCPLRLGDGHSWLDTRPMLDPRECSGAAIDLASEHLSYLGAAGIATRHPTMRHLVRLRLPMAPSDDVVV